MTALFLAGGLFAINSLSVGQKKDNSIITLNKCWSYRSTDILSLRPAVDKSNVYIAETGGRVSAVSLSSGTRLWSTDLGGEIRSNLVVQGPSVFVAASDGSRRMRLRGLSMNSGIPTSDVEIPFSSDIRLGTVNGRLLVALDSGYLASFPSGNQKPEWQTTIQSLDISSIVFLNDKIVAASSDKLIRVISLTDGRSVSSSSVENNVSALNVFEGDVVAGDSRGNLTRYDDDNRTVSWRFRNGARISSVVPTDRGILAASLDNFVYMASSYDGGVRWKKRMAGRVSSIAAVGNIAVVLTIGEPNAVILNLDNGKSAGELSISEDDAFSQPVIIADGRLLFFTNEQILAESSQPCP